MSSTIRSRAEELDLTLSQVQRRSGMARATFWRRMKANDWERLELNAMAHVLGFRTTAELLGEDAAA